jgi:outer membrane protein
VVALKLEAGQWVQRSSVALLAGLVLAGAATAQPAPTSTANAGTVVKIGYIDVKRLIDSSQQMADARTRIRHEFEARDDAIKADDAKLAALRQRYERDSAIMTKQDADALKREVDATERANKRTKDEAKVELNERTRAEWTRVSQMIQDTAIEYARTQGYDIVIGSESALFANPRLDITDAVLQRLKQAAPAAKKP